MTKCTDKDCGYYGQHKASSCGCIHDTEVKAAHPEMTLRDYFAAKAMQAIIPSVIHKVSVTEDSDAILAKASYALADAMLKARKA